MTDDRYYAGIKRLIQTTDIDQANQLLKDGTHELLKTIETTTTMFVLGEKASGQAQSEELSTGKQVGYIEALRKKSAANEDTIKKFLEKAGKEDASRLTRVKASELIELMKI